MRAKRADAISDQQKVVEVAEDPIALGCQRDGVLDATLVERDLAEEAERDPLGERVVCLPGLTDDRFVQRAGAFEVAALVVRPGVRSSRAQCVVPVAELAELSHALAEELLRSRPVALLPGGVGDHESGEGGTPGVAELLVELECLPSPTAPRRNVAARQRHVRCSAERLGTSRRRALIRSERVFDATAAFRPMPLLVPEAPECRDEPHDTVGLADRLEPVHRDAEVVVVELQGIEPLLAAPDPDQIGLGLLGERQEVLGVAPPQRFGSGRLLEPLGCVLADRLEHPEAVAPAGANEALVDE